MKYVLARNTHSAGTYYYERTKGGAGYYPTGTPKLSETVVFDTAEEALDTLRRNERLKLHEYYVVVIDEKDLFKAKLKDA